MALRSILGFDTSSFCSCTTVPVANNQTTRLMNPIDTRQAVKAILDIPSLVARLQRTCASTSNHTNKYINTSTSQQPTNTTAYLPRTTTRTAKATACHARAGRSVGIRGRAVFLEVGRTHISFGLRRRRLPSLREVVCFEEAGWPEDESRKRSEPA